MTTQIEVATQIAEICSGAYGFGRCSVWDKKEGELRVYLGKNGYVEIKESVSLAKVKAYKKEVSELIGNLANIKNLLTAEAETFRNGLVARYGLVDVIDAEADVARENWDI